MIVIFGHVLMQVNNLPSNYGWQNVYDNIDPIQLQTYYFGQKAQESFYSSSEKIKVYIIISTLMVQNQCALNR